MDVRRCNAAAVSVTIVNIFVLFLCSIFVDLVLNVLVRFILLLCVGNVLDCLIMKFSINV